MCHGCTSPSKSPIFSNLLREISQQFCLQNWRNMKNVLIFRTLSPLRHLQLTNRTGYYDVFAMQSHSAFHFAYGSMANFTNTAISQEICGPTIKLFDPTFGPLSVQYWIRH